MSLLRELKYWDGITEADAFGLDTTKRWWNQMQRARRENKDFPPLPPCKIQSSGYAWGGRIFDHDELLPFLEWKENRDGSCNNTV